jgi:hypothetical protein
MTQELSELHSRAGVYRSDVDGHLLILKLSPTRVTCVVCLETCDRSHYKTEREFKTAAVVFVDKHGALDEKIAESIEEIIPRAAVVSAD